MTGKFFSEREIQPKTTAHFRSYHQAVSLYALAKPIQLHYGLKDQLMRAASSVALNLKEGSAKPSTKERTRFYLIAFASLKEVQGFIELEPKACQTLAIPADQLGGCLYKLVRATVS